MGRKSWWVDWHGRSAPIVRASDLRGDDVVNPRSRTLRADVDRWMNDTHTRHVMADLYQSLTGGFDLLGLLGAIGLASSAAQQRVMRDRIVMAFADGTIVLLQPLELPVPANAPEGDPMGDDIFNLFDTWVEIELLDPDGAVMANANYKIVTPDGALHEGTTDAMGKARVDDLPDPGACQIEFPGLVERSWGLRNP